MTSSLATNAVLPGLSVQNYLAVDRNGYPLQGQVAKKTQVYSGAGGTLQLDGSPFVLITGAMAGDLTIDLTGVLYNLIGRSITIATTADHVGQVIVDASGHTLADSGGVVGAGTATVATTIATSFTLHFLDADTIGIEHGAGVTVAAPAGLMMFAAADTRLERQASASNLTAQKKTSPTRRPKTPVRSDEF